MRGSFTCPDKACPIRLHNKSFQFIQKVVDFQRLRDVSVHAGLQRFFLVLVEGVGVQVELKLPTMIAAAAAAAKSLQSCPTLCDPMTAAHQASPSLGFSRQEHWSGLPLPSPMHESEK